MSAIQYLTFTAFHDAVKDEVAPEGLAENLIIPFRSWVGYALADIQTWIPWYRTFNFQFTTKEAAHEFCSTSIFQGPQGKITQMFAYKPGKDCARYYYKRSSQAEIDCWMDRQRCLCPATDPPASNIYDSPYCNYVIPGEESCSSPYLTGEEDDTRFKNLDDDVRIFTVGPDYRVYAAPRFPCGYILLLQWQGINRTWGDYDLVPVDDQLRECVVQFVENKVFAKQNHGLNSQYYDAYVMALRTLKHRFGDEHRTPKERDCTAAIAQITSTFQPAYETPVYGPATA